MRLYLLISFIALATACGGSVNTSNNTAPNVNNSSTANRPGSMNISTYEIVNTYPHDPKAFTQGLDFYNGALYEGTGGKQGDNFYSSLRKVELETGKVLQKHDLSRDFFGEGITVLNDKIYQLTWRERTAFVYNVNDFGMLRQHQYAGEGWGLANDSTDLYMSDGTHVIRVIDPETFQTKRTIVVLDERGQPLMQLNELEFVKGEIWANIWQTGWIVRIDPASGKLLGRIDLKKLADQEMRSSSDADVMNGIAYDEATDRIFITGKMWRRLFEIKVVTQP